MTSQEVSPQISPDSIEGGGINHQQEGATPGNDFKGIRFGAHAELSEVLNLVDQKKAVDVVVLHSEDYQAMGALCMHMVILTCVSR